ncbi:hypothetical protein C8R47DRAFT_1218674 [Mycena vitilis]|nr:hypothetical protein C8R47DRAFT_1218674 [Mycena vitilis]
MRSSSIANPSVGWTPNPLTREMTLGNASYHTIVLLNVDTLYSEGLLDLSGGDLVGTIRRPKYPASLPTNSRHNSYGNNICNIDTTTTNSTAGKYLIKHRPSYPGCVAGDGEYEGTVYLPTFYGAALLRIKLSNPSDTDHVSRFNPISR